VLNLCVSPGYKSLYLRRRGYVCILEAFYHEKTELDKLLGFEKHCNMETSKKSKQHFDVAKMLSSSSKKYAKV